MPDTYNDLRTKRTEVSIARFAPEGKETFTREQLIRAVTSSTIAAFNDGATCAQDNPELAPNISVTGKIMETLEENAFQIRLV